MRALHDLHAACASLVHRGWGAEREKLSWCSWGVCSMLGASKSCGVQRRVNPSCPRSLSCPPSLFSLRARKHHIQVIATPRIAVSLQKYHKSIVDLIVSQDVRTNHHVLTLLTLLTAYVFLKSPGAPVALPSASKPLCTLDKWSCIEFRVLKAGLFALDRTEIVLTMLLFCLGNKILCLQQRFPLSWHIWKALTRPGAPKALAQVFNKQMVYFVYFQFLFLLVMVRQEEKSIPSPPDFENTSTNISVAGGGFAAERDLRDDDFLFRKTL